MYVSLVRLLSCPAMTLILHIFVEVKAAHCLAIKVVGISFELLFLRNK